MTPSPCPICGDRPRRQDESFGLVQGIAMGFWAVLESGCGLRLRRYSQPDGTTDLVEKWNAMSKEPAL